MDLNPYKFEAPFNKFEFSMSSYSQRAKLLICPMAWLNPSSPSILDNEEFDKSDKLELAQELESELKENLDSAEASWSTINYWILRFSLIYLIKIVSCPNGSTTKPVLKPVMMKK